MRPISRDRVIARLLLTVAIGLPLRAQTYTPKEIRIDAPASVDTAETLRIAALSADAPLTKQQIEAALQRLADTGLFSDIGYTVNSTALVIKLTPSRSNQSLPVRYGNFVWWQPGELEPLVEARLPIFKGRLPATGTLTDQVEAVLVDLLRQKGVDAKLSASLAADAPGGPLTATNITLEQPRVVVGELDLRNELPALKTPLSNFANGLHDQDFDTGETYTSIHLTVADIYQNAGYLDATIAPPAYSAPRKEKDHYVVDLTTSVISGDIYRIAGINIQPAAPLAQPELLKAADIKVGDPASPLALRIAHGELDRAFSDRGYLDIKTSIKTATDRVAHAVVYEIAFAPGEVYHFAGIDTSALTPSQQAAFAHSFHVAPGAVADRDLISAIFRALTETHPAKMPRLNRKTDPSKHIVVYALQPPNASAPN